MASSSVSSIRKNFKYDVFLSFRGTDTRNSFVAHLYAALMQRGIRTFKDDVDLQKGERIDELLEIIELSKLFIIVFSENYASSSWCLRELAKIMECRKNKEQTAYPLFYNVDPSDVRKQSGSFGRAFSEQNNEHFGKWKEALTEAGNLVGLDLRNRNEAEAIDQIAKDISKKLRFTLWSKDENLIGMEPRMRALEWFSGIGSDDEVRMIGIKGMGGIGKTTLARAIFEELFLRFEFEGVSFIENVREISGKQGLLALQKQVLSDVLSVSSQEIDQVKSVHEGKSKMERRLPCIRVLLVLDDVDSEEQLEALAVASKWFKSGSRVIITTRYEKVLTERVNKIHDVSLLSDEEAVVLFSRYAFKRDTPDQGYEKLSSEVVRYAAGLPLTIKVLGSFLRGEKVPVWMDMLKELKTIPCDETFKILEISYNGLKKEYQEIFLDVACFMKGWMYHDAVRFLESRGRSPKVALRFLELRSLITISNERLDMHDSLEEMGRHIVRQSHPDEPSKHSRLWKDEEIEELLSDDEEIEAICIRVKLGELSLGNIIKGFGNLKKLRAVLLSGSGDDYPSNEWKFDQVKKYLPNALRYLRWDDYPVGSLPESFPLQHLVALVMPRSKITQLWEGGEKKVLKSVRFLDLSFSKLATLDLTLTPKLEWLHLKECHDLVELHMPVGSLKQLDYLNLIGCSKFDSFSFIKQFESLEVLPLSKLNLTANSQLPEIQFTCLYSEEQPSAIENGQKSVSLHLQPRTKFENVSEIVCGIQHIRHLTFDGFIPEVPNDLDQLRCLEKLSFLGQSIRRNLPDSVTWMKTVQSIQLQSPDARRKSILHLEGSSEDAVKEKMKILSSLPAMISRLNLKPINLKPIKHMSSVPLEKVPENRGQLRSVKRFNTSASITRLPDSICMLTNLKSLEVKNCGSLQKLPEDLGQLECLKELILTECMSLEDIPNSICMMKSLKCFHLTFCVRVKKLPEKLGLLECLKELNVDGSGISHLPHSISSLKGLRIVGSRAVLESCSSANEIQTSEGETFCYI